jgi:hypothetical protein
MLAGLDTDDVAAALQALLKIDTPDLQAGNDGSGKGRWSE